MGSFKIAEEYNEDCSHECWRALIEAAYLRICLRLYRWRQMVPRVQGAHVHPSVLQKNVGRAWPGVLRMQRSAPLNALSQSMLATYA